MTDHNSPTPKRGLTYVFDLEPVAKGRPRLGKYGGVFTPQATKTFEAMVGYQARAQHKALPLEGPLKLILRFYLKPPVRKTREHPSGRPDIDNYLKAILDALNGIVWIDDAQVCQIKAIKIYDWVDRRGRIEMEVTQIEGEKKCPTTSQ